MVALLYLSVVLLLLSCLISMCNSPDAAQSPVGRGFYGMAVGLAVAGLIAFAGYGISCVDPPNNTKTTTVRTVSN